MQPDRFRRSPDSTLWPADDAGLAALVACLDAGGAPAVGRDGTVGCRPSAIPQLFVETSGSTGRAKTIRRSQASWIASFGVNRDLFGLGATDCYATLGALGHSLTLYATLEALFLGADLRALAGLAPRYQLQALQPATVLYATPSQLRLLLAGAGTAVRAGMRLVMVGGGTLDPVLRAGLTRLFPAADIREFFGAAETSFLTLSDPQTPAGSVGRAYPGVTLDIRDGTTPAAPGVAGEIWAASPYLFDGYDSGDSRDTRREGAFLSIGEMGLLDSAGYLILKGRKTRMIRVAEHSVFPEDVERLLATDPAVTLCAVIPEADALRGQHLVAVVQGDPACEGRLRTLCRAGLPAHAAPRRYVFLDTLPLLAAGKPDLQALTETVGGMP